ncbi:transglutaminase domain-containing protein [Tsuneonella sp. HG094]
MDNPSLLATPKDAPPRYRWQRVLEFSDFPSWTAVSARFSTLFDESRRLEAGSPLKTEAARIAAQHATTRARAAAALSLVQEQVRYVYVGLDGGNYRPATAEETWRRRYGDCKGKTALLLALLDELGIPAQAVVVSNTGSDDGLSERLPNPGLFDHVLVRATIDGERLWLDGTLPGVFEMGTKPVVFYRSVLPLSKEGTPLEKLAQNPAQLPDEMGLHEIDARAGFDKPARMVQTTVKRGVDGLVEYLQLSPLTPDQLTQGFQNAVAGGSQWDAIDKVAYRFDRATQASILSITGTGPVDWDKSGETYDLSLPGGGFSPPERRQRPPQQDQLAPFYTQPTYSCYATTIRLPDATPLTNWGFNSTFDTLIFGRAYYRMMEKRDDRTIRLVRGSRVERIEISAADAKRDNDRLARFDNSKANITYDPSQTMEPWGTLSSVPAVYELDWTGADVPCLPSDMLKTR